MEEKVVVSASALSASTDDRDAETCIHGREGDASGVCKCIDGGTNPDANPIKATARIILPNNVLCILFDAALVVLLLDAINKGQQARNRRRRPTDSRYFNDMVTDE